MAVKHSHVRSGNALLARQRAECVAASECLPAVDGAAAPAITCVVGDLDQIPGQACDALGIGFEAHPCNYSVKARGSAERRAYIYHSVGVLWQRKHEHIRYSKNVVASEQVVTFARKPQQPVLPPHRGGGGNPYRRRD